MLSIRSYRLMIGARWGPSIKVLVGIWDARFVLHARRRLTNVERPSASGIRLMLARQKNWLKKEPSVN